MYRERLSWVQVIGNSPVSRPAMSLGTPPAGKYKYPFWSGPIPATIWPSGETENELASTPSGEIACGFPPETLCTYRRTPCSSSLPENTKRLPSGNQRAHWWLIESLVSGLVSPAPLTFLVGLFKIRFLGYHYLK